MLNVSKLLKLAGIATSTLGTTWLVAGWCNHCNKSHRGNRCPAQTIGAANHPYDCNNQPYGCGYGCYNPYENGYNQGRRQGYNEAYRDFNCLQWFNEWECEGWDSDDEEEYVQQAEARARELRRRRNHHHDQSEARRRQQAIDNIRTINSQDDLQAILYALQNRAQNLGFQIRGGQIVRQGFNPCGGYDPYGCNEMHHQDYGCYHCLQHNLYEDNHAQNEQDVNDVMNRVRERVQNMTTSDELCEALYIFHYHVKNAGFSIAEFAGTLQIQPCGKNEEFAISVAIAPSPDMEFICQSGNMQEMQTIVDLIVERARQLGFYWLEGQFHRY